MKLLIDIGNSRVKWACWVDQQLQAPRVLSHEDWDPLELLAENRKQQRPEQVYIANVAGRHIGDRIAKAITKRWRLAPVFVKVQRRNLGVINAYHDVAQLGIDRWLGLLAARHRYRTAVCVVNCGTAVTVDGLSPTGRHLGGFIIPGLGLLQQQLNRATSAIKVKPGRRYATQFGRSTAACVQNGAARAVVALVEHVSGELSEKYGRKLARVITGGDGRSINALLGKTFDHDPHLVLYGLGLIAEQSR